MADVAAASTRLQEPRWLVLSAERVTLLEARAAIGMTFGEFPEEDEIEVVREPGWLGRIYVLDRDSFDAEISTCCGDPGDCRGCA